MLSLYGHMTEKATLSSKKLWYYGAMGYMTEQANAHNEVTLRTFCKDHLKAVTDYFEDKLPYRERGVSFDPVLDTIFGHLCVLSMASDMLPLASLSF